MTSASSERQDEVREALRAIIDDPAYGVPALSSPQIMANLLKDYLPGARREQGVLVAAAEAGLAQALGERVAQGMDVATAESLAASDLAEQAPFTPEACRWAVTELSAALGLRPAGTGGGLTDNQAIPPVAPPDEVTRPPVGQSRVPDQDQTRPASSTGPVPADPAQPKPAQPRPAQPTPARPKPARPKPARGRGLPRWAWVAGAVAVVAIVVIVVVVSRHPTPGPAAPVAVTPLAAMLSPDTGDSPPTLIDCHQAALGGMSGVTANVFCLGATSTGTVDGIKFEAYQFATTADYQAGFAHLNKFFGYDVSGASQGCGKTTNTTCSAQWWQNPRYPKTPGQKFEELYTVNSSGYHPTDIWTIERQRVVFAAQDSITDSTIPEMYTWWQSLPDLKCKIGCGS